MALKKQNPGCGCCGCSCVRCADGIVACSYQVEISGIANSVCLFCEELNGTYLFGPEDYTPNEGGINCVFEISIAEVCSMFRARIVIGGGAFGADWFILFSLSDTGGTQITWSQTFPFAGKPDCDTLNNFDLPFNSNLSDCGPAASICRITAL